MWTLRSVIDLPLLSGRLSPSCWPQSVADIDDYSQHLKAFETSTCNAYDLSIPHFAMPISCVCMCSYKHLRLEHPAVALCLEHHLSHPLMHPRGTPRKH